MDSFVCEYNPEEIGISLRDDLDSGNRKSSQTGKL